MGIKVVKEKKARDYTFIDDGLDLEKPAEKEPEDKKRTERDFRLRGDSSANKLKKSKITGGHSKQGHSPVYE